MDQNWNAKACLARHWGDANGNFTDSAESQCPPVWDGFSCWGPTAAGTVALAKCPSFKGSDVTKSAYRVCSASGEWLNRNGVPTPNGWTNYTPCLTPEILEIMRRLGTNDDAQTKFNIAVNTRILEFVGLSLSLAALLLSLLIFYYFRTLRNSRTRLHRHLFIAMVIQVAIRLIVYTDQAITRSFDGSSDGNTNASYSQASGESPHRRGIDNTPILCEASYISLEYARTAMFMWMFVEGLFLHNMITVTVFEEKLSPLVYPIIGWVLPVPLTVAWAVVTHLHYGTATCWWGYNFTLYFWILEGPRLAVLMVNLAFLLNILRVLITKLRQSNSSETQQAMKAVKAALVLLPLLGLTNLLNMLDAPLEKSPFQFALWSYSTHLLTSTQGFVLAFLYCFRNGEVQIAVRKFFRVRIFGNSKNTTFIKKPIQLSALNNGSLFQNSGNQSEDNSQTVNMLNANSSPMVLLHKNSGSITIPPNHSYPYSSPTHSGNNNNTSFSQKSGKCSRSKFSTPSGSLSTAPPLVVRSFSNGVLKQTVLRDQSRLSKLSNSNSKNLADRRSLHRNSSYLSDDHAGTRPLLQNQQKTCIEYTPASSNSNSNIHPVSSSLQQLPPHSLHQQHPINSGVPMTSSSSWSSGASSTTSSSVSNSNKEPIHHPHEFPLQSKFQRENTTNNNNSSSTSRMNKLGKQIANSWGMVIIPEPLLKRMRGQLNQQEDNDLVGSAESKINQSQNSPQKKKKLMRMSNSSSISKGIQVVVREDEDISEEIEQDISTSSSSGARGTGGESFFSVDMLSAEEDGFRLSTMNSNRTEPQVHISLEIMKI